MATIVSLEDRLAVLERTVAELQKQVQAKKSRWIDKIIGSMAKEPDFDEVVRLGREWRRSQRLHEDSEP